MADGFDDEFAAWRQCEIAWSVWLQASDWSITNLAGAVGNHPNNRAPLMAVAGEMCRAPDLLASKGGVNEYWEVKYRTQADRDAAQGNREHWVEYAAFRDYLTVSRGTGCKVWIILHEASGNGGRGEWLKIDVEDLADNGRRGRKFGTGAVEVEAWIWSVEHMEIVRGPNVLVPLSDAPVNPEEGIAPTLNVEDFGPLERRVRGRAKNRQTQVGPESKLEEAEQIRLVAVLEKERQLGLEILSRELQLLTVPRYSVLFIGLKDLEIDDVLGLLDYGIRVFLISETQNQDLFDDENLKAFKESRLLEWAVVPNLGGSNQVIIDGVFPVPLPKSVRDACEEAERTGGINFRQYEVVHCPLDADIKVIAGAGTGKTETMSERLIFLLATGEGRDETAGRLRPFDLRLDDVVLVTFTREAAREMRERIARTLMLRQRLSNRCVLPALAWMMQLSTTQISTIHAFGKSLSKQAASNVGIGPSFTVSKQTMRFREILHQALSPHLSLLLHSEDRQSVPAVHLWMKHIQGLWDALDNNGIELLGLAEPHDYVASVDWGGAGLQGLEKTIAETCKKVIEDVASDFRKSCLENQSVPMSQLVSLALAGITAEDHPSVKAPRYLFVDEFQDTDTQQMKFLLEVRKKLGSRLFVVGDPKQAIYRFRGAEGDAFKSLDKLAESHNKTVKLHNELVKSGAKKGVAEQEINFVEKLLTRNFRSGSVLLDSLHPLFAIWGENGHLPYKKENRLLPDVEKVGLGKKISYINSNNNSFPTQAAKHIMLWRQKNPNAKIAVLCRRNYHAIKVKQEIQRLGGTCELLVGGGFYTTEAVREMRVLLAAVSNPDDNAALLELCETRWAAGIMKCNPPPSLRKRDRLLWGESIEGVLPWGARFATITTTGSFDVSDLERLRTRIFLMAGMLEGLSMMAWIVECNRWFAPGGCAKPDDSEISRRQYDRCFDHLLTEMDLEFVEYPTTLERVLFWLELQIATNTLEDEPVDSDDLEGTTTALTVHKSKGLEFDLVLIPNSWTGFATPKHVSTEVSVMPGKNGIPAIAWKWKGGPENKTGFSNGSSSQILKHWKSNEEEIFDEETRLLYVAATRARTELVVFMYGKNEESWGGLIRMAGGGR
jgi:superfamily I DNA/RNA helicase